MNGPIKLRLITSKNHLHISQIAMFTNVCLQITEFVFDTVLTPVRDLGSAVQCLGWVHSEYFVFFG